MKLWIPNQVGDDMLLGSPIKDFGDDGLMTQNDTAPSYPEGTYFTS